ncbi:MAG: ATP-binding protein, partial [Terrimicrobiaceae bacterium]
VEVERHRGSQGVYVDWRHVLPQLLRKPGAFARWRHREHMFPSRMWRELYDALLSRQSGGRAEREYLGMLALALEHGLEKIEEKILLFTFFAERYERRSLMISSNLVFSQWERIFQDPMTAMAAVDRLVHHSVILEFGGESQRMPKTQKGGKPTG